MARAIGRVADYLACAAVIAPGSTCLVARDDGGEQKADGSLAHTGWRWLIGVGLTGALAAAVPGVADLRTIPRGQRHRAPRACT